MNWSQIADQAGKALPVLGTLLAGQMGGVVGNLVAGALGVNADPFEVSQALLSPDKQAELQQWAYRHRETLEALALQTLQVELSDKANARAEHKHSKMPAVVTVALTAIVAALLGTLFWAELPEANREVAYMLFGQACALWGATVTYWVGTTRSSAEKNRLMVK